jgi:hypothetical protein
MPSNRKRMFLFGGIGAVVICLSLLIAGGVWIMNDPQVQADVSATDTAQARAAAVDAVTATTEFDTLQARLANKQVLLNESFSKSDAFTGQNLSDAFKGGVQNGVYHAGVYITTSSSTLERILPLGKELTDFVAEVDCTSSDPDGFCGIAYDMQPVASMNVKSYYVSAVGDINECDFASVLRTGWSTNSIGGCAAGRQPNHLRVERFGIYLRFYVNDQLIDAKELKDDGMGSGDVGLYFGANTPANFAKQIDLTADNFQVWSLP